MQSCLQRAPTGGPRGASAGSRLCAQVGDLMNWLLSTVNLSTVPTFFVLRTAAQFLGRTKEKKRKEKKRKEKKRSFGISIMSSQKSYRAAQRAGLYMDAVFFQPGLFWHQHSALLLSSFVGCALLLCMYCRSR